MRFQNALRTLIQSAVALSFGLASCTTQQLSVRATEFNKSFEKSNNEVLLLNVLRASVRRPLYFTSFQALHGGAGFAPGTSTIALPFGPGAESEAGSRTLSQTLGFTASTFDMTTADGQDFMRGIMTPVDKKLISYMWSEGWPQELLWMLFIRRFDVEYGDPNLLTDSDKDLFGLVKQCEPKATRMAGKAEFENYPADGIKTEKYKCMMRLLLAQKFGLASVKSSSMEDIGPEVDARSVRLKDLISIAKSDGLSLKKVNGEHYQLQKSDTSFGWAGGGGNCDTDSAKPKPVDTPCRAYYKEKCKEAVPDDSSPYHCRPQSIEIFVRSPEAIIYYLGELVRVANSTDGGGALSQLDAKVCGKQNKESPIFKLDSIDENDPSVALKVQFDGHTYGMHRASSTKSYIQCKQETALHVLSIVNQLIDLQRTAKEAPTTSVVRLIP